MASFRSINDYIKQIRTFKRAANIFTGQLYAYNYLFTKAPNFESAEFDVVKFYDFYPATFVFDVNRETKTFHGLNFHHMPVKARKLWLTRVQKIVPKPFETSGVTRIRNLTFPKLKVLFKKSMFGVRQYRMDRVRQLRIVPNQDWEELFEFFAKTYFGVTLAQVEAKYRSFRPR